YSEPSVSCIFAMRWNGNGRISPVDMAPLARHNNFYNVAYNVVELEDPAAWARSRRCGHPFPRGHSTMKSRILAVAGVTALAATALAGCAGGAAAGDD